MSYEAKIGWRYLFRGSRSRRTALAALISALVATVGGYLYLGLGDISIFPIVLFVGGMLACVSFALQHFFSVFTTVSVLGVVLGVAALTVVLAVTTGFQRQFREKVLGVNAHVLVRKSGFNFVEHADVEKAAAEIDPDVLAVHPFVFVEMQVTRGRGEVAGVAIKGVDPSRVTAVLDLQRHLIEGTVESLAERPEGDAPPPIILGRELARKLHANVGDMVTVVSPLSHIDVNRWAPTGRPPKTKKFKVSGIFYAGFDEYDRRLMYIHLREAQELVDQGDIVTGVELRVRDVERAKEIAIKLDSALGGAPYIVQDWRDLNENLFDALALQKLALLIVLTLIIAVATFNMVSALTMLVIDKTREVAILKSMGATAGGISRIFQVVGLMIGALGTGLGLAIGLPVCEVVARYGYRLDPKVYLIDRLPIDIVPFEVVLVGVITMVISGLATLFPASKASGLRPVEGLRYD